MAGWAVRQIEDVPKVTDGDPGDPDWHALQHHFGLTAFGANVFVARVGNETLIGEHDETASGQEELYIVLEGEVAFELSGEAFTAGRGTVISVTDPRVKRRAVARSAGATILAIGSRPGAFESTWRAQHFKDLPRA